MGRKHPCGETPGIWTGDAALAEPLQVSVRRAATAQPLGLVVSFLAGWSFVYGALTLAAFMGVLGFLGELAVAASNVSGGQAVLTILWTTVEFAEGTFLSVLVSVLLNPLALVPGLATGVVATACLLLGHATLEPWLAYLQGCRRLSVEEAGRVMPLASAASHGVGLDGRLPRILVDESHESNAATMMRHVVLTEGLLASCRDEELSAVLAHELSHWKESDTVGLRLMWYAGWPMMLVDTLGKLCVMTGNTILVIFGYVVAWPAFFLVNVVISPLLRSHSRETEYRADQAAVGAGYAAGMRAALDQFGDLEGERRGYRLTVLATHPSVELRKERVG